MTDVIEVMKQFEGLVEASDKLGVQVKDASQIIERQTRMLNLMLDELISLAQADAIHPFFRNRILGTLGKVRAIGLPS